MTDPREPTDYDKALFEKIKPKFIHQLNGPINDHGQTEHETAIISVLQQAHNYTLDVKVKKKRYKITFEAKNGEIDTFDVEEREIGRE